MMDALRSLVLVIPRPKGTRLAQIDAFAETQKWALAVKAWGAKVD